MNKPDDPWLEMECVCCGRSPHMGYWRRVWEKIYWNRHMNIKKYPAREALRVRGR